MASDASKSQLKVRNPATGDEIKEVPIFSPDDVAEEVGRARKAQSRWARVHIEDRCEQIAKVRDVIAGRMDEIAKVISEENGKVVQEALMLDVGPTLAVIDYFTKEAPRILAPERIRLVLARHRRSYISYQAKGVVGVISPWNFPFFLPASDVVMSLIAGNAAVVKPSEITPLSTLILKDCFDEAGIDPDLFRVVTGLGKTGQALIDARPDHVIFTGSVRTGKRIAVACAEHLIPCALELGGKAPAVVLDDADLERTANAIVWGGFCNSGQVCASVERVYATPKIYDSLSQRVTEKASELRVGAPGGDAVVDMGAITFEHQIDRINDLVGEAKDKGAVVTTGGEAIGGDGWFYQPTVVTGCNHDMKIMKEEIFGPVVPIMRVDDERQAVELANDSDLGLGAYVFTTDSSKAREIAEKIEAGSIMVNDVIAHAGMAEMPWGGIKTSGLGVVRSDAGLRALAHARHINEPRVGAWPDKDPHWYPYSKRTRRNSARFLRAMFGESVGSKVARWILN